MIFKKLKLYTNKLNLELEFYTKTLGFEIVEQTLNSFAIKVGWTELAFERSEKEHLYHYCFLIPANKLPESLEWMEKRTEVIKIENNRKIQNFESWNADSFYFYDASGNVAEFIVGYDLENNDEIDFDCSRVLGINEMGMPTVSVKKLNNQLQIELKTEFWKGDLERFGTNGSQEGMFLLPNYELKDLWFPTSIKIKPEPFEAIVENKGKEYFLQYRNGELEITPNNSKN